MTKANCFLGIDVGKFNHQASLIDDQGNLIGCSIRFANNLSSFERFLAEIKKRLPEKAILKVGLESTGHYWFNLRNFLNKNGFSSIEVFNPIETRERAKKRIRKVKNDRIDSLEIAKMIKERKEEESFVWPENLRKLKNLTRFSEKLKSQEKFFKREIVNLLERIWPEFKGFFSNLFLTSHLVILENLEKMATIKEEEFSQLLKESSRQRINKEKAKKILDSFKESIGQELRDEFSFLQLRILLENLKLIQSQVKEVKEKINEFSKNFPVINEIKKSQKGLSCYLSSICLAEIGEIERFSSPEKLVAFAGLDPSVYQSGSYYRQRGNHISKRGSKYLRKALYYAAKTAVIFDPQFKTFYQKKKLQGKHYNVIIIAVARKILVRIYHLLKQKRLDTLNTSQVFSLTNPLTVS